MLAESFKFGVRSDELVEGRVKANELEMRSGLI
jgi:hypothetical protein